MADPLPPMVLLSVRDGASNAFDVIELPGPIRVEASLPFRGNDSGVGGLLRAGWVLFHARGTHANLAAPDGELRTAVELPRGRVAPAADPMLALVTQEGHVRLVDAAGTVLRSSHLPEQVTGPDGRARATGLVQGECPDGRLVTTRGLFDWAGGPGTAFEDGLSCQAVLSGGHLCLTTSGRLVLREVETGTDLDVEVEGDRLASEVGTNPSGTAAAFRTPPDYRGLDLRHSLSVLRPGRAPLTVDAPAFGSKGCWIDDVHLLYAGEGKAILIDTTTGATRPVRGAPSWPELSVTGRFTAAMFEADAPAPARPPRKKGDKALPRAAVTSMKAGARFDQGPGGGEAGPVVLGRSPEAVGLPVDSDGQPWATDDPHRGAGGHYLVLAESLIEDCEGYEPLGLLVWLPREGCFGSWDGDHRNLVTFPGARWADIIADPDRYLGALWQSDDDPVLVPVGLHPYVTADGTTLDPTDLRGDR